MCGRYAVATPWKDVIELLDATAEGEVEGAATYNICPTDPAPIVKSGPDHGRVAAVHRWGLVPWWSSDKKGAARLINARSETVASTRAFREAFQTARCLVPASGFYEWTALPDGKGKQPHWIHPEEGELLTFAGLWARWGAPGATPHWSFTILTTAASEAVAMLHDRMPVIIRQADRGQWLDPAAPEAALQALLRPFPGVLRHHPVEQLVNNVRADGPELIAPARRNLELVL